MHLWHKYLLVQQVFKVRDKHLFSLPSLSLYFFLSPPRWSSHNKTETRTAKLLWVPGHMKLFGTPHEYVIILHVTIPTSFSAVARARIYWSCCTRQRFVSIYSSSPWCEVVWFHFISIYPTLSHIAVAVWRYCCCCCRCFRCKIEKYYLRMSIATRLLS